MSSNEFEIVTREIHKFPRAPNAMARLAAAVLETVGTGDAVRVPTPRGHMDRNTTTTSVRIRLKGLNPNLAVRTHKESETVLLIWAIERPTE